MLRVSACLSKARVLENALFRLSSKRAVLMSNIKRDLGQRKARAAKHLTTGVKIPD